MGKDYHAEGQRDYEKSGGQSPNPPRVSGTFGGADKRREDAANREAYQSGWNNARKQDR